MSKRRQRQTMLHENSPIPAVHDDPIDAWDPWAVLVIAMAASRAWDDLRRKTVVTASATEVKTVRTRTGSHATLGPGAKRANRLRSRSAA